MPKGSTKDWEDNSLKGPGGQGEARHFKVDETMGQRGVERTILGTPNIDQPNIVFTVRQACCKPQREIYSFRQTDRP